MNFTPTDENTNYIPPIIHIPGRPSSAQYFLWAAVCGLCAAFLGEIGALSYVGMCAASLFMVSAKAPIWSYFLPAAGVTLLWLRNDFSTDTLTLTVLYTVLVAILSALAGGWVLCRRDGDFHRSLTVFTAVGSAAAVILAAVIFKKYGLDAEGVAAYLTELLQSTVERLGASPYNTLGEAELALLISEGPAMVRSALYYLPAVVVILIELCGIVALRITGLLHDVNNTAYYHPKRRQSRLDTPYAILFFVAMVMTLAGGNTALGVVSGNVMLVMLAPAIAAGVSAYMEGRRRKRESGRPTGMFSVLIIIAIMLYIPSIALFIPAVYGCVVAVKAALRRMKER